MNNKNNAQVVLYDFSSKKKDAKEQKRLILPLNVRQVSQLLSESRFVIQNWIRTFGNQLNLQKNESGHYCFNLEAVRDIYLIKILHREHHYSVKQILSLFSTDDRSQLPEVSLSDLNVKLIEEVPSSEQHKKMKKYEKLNQSQAMIGPSTSKRFETKQESLPSQQLETGFDERMRQLEIKLESLLDEELKTQQKLDDVLEAIRKEAQTKEIVSNWELTLNKLIEQIRYSKPAEYQKQAKEEHDDNRVHLAQQTCSENPPDASLSSDEPLSSLSESNEKQETDKQEEDSSHRSDWKTIDPTEVKTSLPIERGKIVKKDEDEVPKTKVDDYVWVPRSIKHNKKRKRRNNR